MNDREPRRWDGDQPHYDDYGYDGVHDWPDEANGRGSVEAFATILAEREAGGGTLNDPDETLTPTKPGVRVVGHVDPETSVVDAG